MGLRMLLLHAIYLPCIPISGIASSCQCHSVYCLLRTAAGPVAYIDLFIQRNGYKVGLLSTQATLTKKHDEHCTKRGRKLTLHVSTASVVKGAWPGSY